MKRMLVPLFAVALMLFTSCKKDFLHGNPDGVLNCCRVEKTIQSYLDDHGGIIDTDTFTFNYNQWNNPVSIKRDLNSFSLNYVFGYDSRNRLTDLVGVDYDINDINQFDGHTYLVWHKYVYDHRDRIIADTSYFPDIFTPTNTIIQLTDSIQYDAKNRVVKEKTTVFYDIILGLSEIHHISYTYGNDDNLQGRVDVYYRPSNPGEIHYDSVGSLFYYDDKVNPRRTNKIYMFIDRDYSVNNRFLAHEYNDFGLPTFISNEFNGDDGYAVLATLGFRPNEIQYNCNEPVTIKK